jgi:hypothetical protein
VPPQVVSNRLTGFFTLSEPWLHFFLAWTPMPPTKSSPPLSLIRLPTYAPERPTLSPSYLPN